MTLSPILIILLLCAVLASEQTLEVGKSLP